MQYLGREGGGSPYLGCLVGGEDWETMADKTRQAANQRILDMRQLFSIFFFFFSFSDLSVMFPLEQSSSPTGKEYRVHSSLPTTAKAA